MHMLLVLHLITGSSATFQKWKMNPMRALNVMVWHPASKASLWHTHFNPKRILNTADYSICTCATAPTAHYASNQSCCFCKHR